MLFDQIASNKRKTWILLLVFFLLLALVGYAVGYLFIRSGLGGLVIALIIGFIYALSMIFQSTEIVMSMNGAREVDEQTAPDLYHVVEDMALVAPTLVQLAISRQREFLADASSVELTRNPQGMINALDKLDNSKPMSRHVDDASSALYINDPKKGGGFQKLFYTHPPISERIERLKQM